MSNQSPDARLAAALLAHQPDALTEMLIASGLATLPPEVPASLADTRRARGGAGKAMREETR